MEDPVTVRGYREVCPDVDMAIQVPGNVPWFLRYSSGESLCVGNYGREGHTGLQETFPEKKIEFLDLPRTEMIHIVELAIQEVLSDHGWIFEILDIQAAPLEAWKTALVLEGLRRKTAARAIQRRFRESMSNPGYRMCKTRLLREFTTM
jgi:hypothetical protein